VDGSSTWTKWAEANLERSPKACQRCILAAREADTLAARAAVVARADAILAECPPPADPVQDRTLAEAEPDAPVEPVQDGTVDLPLAEATTQIVDDVADTLPGRPALSGNVVIDLAEADLVDADLVDDLQEDVVEVIEPEVLQPEPAIPDPPRQCAKLADLWLALPTAWLREQCLLWTEAQCCDWGPFISSQEAAAACYDYRELCFNWSSPEVRAAFVGWARSLPQPRQQVQPRGEVRP
jgi:hypothetical protein